MTTTKAILTLGVLAVLVLSGAAFAVEETDAAVDPVQFVIGTVTYSSDAGISEDGSTVTLPTLAAIGASVPAGKAFLGWNATSATESTYLAAGTTTAYAAKFYAVMQDITYTVTFDAGNGSAVQTFTGTSSVTFTVPTDPSKEGFIFAGWSLAGAAVELDAGASVTFTADAAYTALWTVDYAVSFVVDGTTISTGSVSDYTIPADPSKEGYGFAGWTDGTVTYSDADLPAFIAGIDAPAVLSAVWEPIAYTVSFVADGATVITETVRYNAAAVEPATVPVKDGYDFAGWDYVFSVPITEDTTINAVFTETPAPEKTGLSNPVTAIAAILVGVIVVFLLAIFVWKREIIMAKVNAKLIKATSKKEGDEKP